MFDQPKLFHLLADLIFVPAKKTCGLCHRPAARWGPVIKAIGLKLD